MPGTLLLCALALSADVLTVDDDAPADFTTIGDAIAAAQPGDVVRVASGTYDGFLLDKDIALVGPGEGTRPLVSGVTRIQGAPRFTLAGFECARLSVSDVPGLGVIDDCSAGVWTPVGTDIAVNISACGQLLVSRCEFEGWDDHGGTAAWVVGSRVSFTSCSIAGGRGLGEPLGTAGPGGLGLSVQGDSQVTIAGTSIRGGNGGESGSIFSPTYAPPGDGLLVVHSDVVVRGQHVDTIAAGGSGKYEGHGLVLFGSGRVIISGVNYDPGTVQLDASSVLLTPAIAEPFVEVLSTPVPAGEVTVQLLGPAATSALLLVALQPGQATLPKLESPLWYEAGSLPIVPLITGSGGVGFVFEMPHDPQLVGSAFILQAVFPTLASTLVPGTKLVTNPAVIAVRP